MENENSNSGELIDLRKIYSVGVNSNLPVFGDEFDILQETDEDLRNYLGLGAKFG